MARGEVSNMTYLDALETAIGVLDNLRQNQPLPAPTPEVLNAWHDAADALNGLAEYVQEARLDA